jgi:hypothetical protein
MFDPEVWGTVSDWTVSALTGLSVVAAVVIYYFDRRRQRRAQAGSILVWLHPHEHGPPAMKMMNLSEKPVFDHGFAITSRPRRRIAKLASEGWKQNPMFKWPENNKLSASHRHSLLNYHDGSELHLGPGQQVEYQPQLGYNDVVYDYYGYFRDAAGKYWAVDARTQRLASSWRRWRLGLGPAGLEAT